MTQSQLYIEGCRLRTRIGFIWLDESVSAYPGLVFVQPIMPGHSSFGLVELGLVVDYGCWNPTLVQHTPGVERLIVFG